MRGATQQTIESSAGFQINKQTLVVKLEKTKVPKEMEFLQKYVVIAYIVVGSLSYTSLPD